jgi:hypothetical protein
MLMFAYKHQTCQQHGLMSVAATVSAAAVGAAPRLANCCMGAATRRGDSRAMCLETDEPPLES